MQFRQPIYVVSSSIRQNKDCCIAPCLLAHMRWVCPARDNCRSVLALRIAENRLPGAIQGHTLLSHKMSYIEQAKFQRVFTDREEFNEEASRNSALVHVANDLLGESDMLAFSVLDVNSIH
jgi:hypothetical protein